MNELQRRLARLLLVAVATSVAVSVAPAGDREFNMITRHLEEHSQMRRSSIPFLGLANLLAPITRPSGFRRLKFASFADPQVGELSSGAGLGPLIHQALSPEWKPLLRHHLRRTGEQSYVYFRTAGTGQELMIVEVRPGDATVMQVTVDAERFTRYIARPGEIGADIENEAR